MSKPKNCWEVKRCGRGPGGDKIDKLGVCPAASESQYNGINRGTNGGRFCWAISGTLCEGKVQGLFAIKIENCLNCQFLWQVKEEEREQFALRPDQGLVENT